MLAVDGLRAAVQAGSWSQPNSNLRHPHPPACQSCTAQRPVQRSVATHVAHASWRSRRSIPPVRAQAADTTGAGAGPSTSGRSLPPDFEAVSPDGRWRVRPLNRNNGKEVRTVVRLQTEGFHVPHPVSFVDGAFKNMFKAEVRQRETERGLFLVRDKLECIYTAHGLIILCFCQVLSEMQKKLRYNPADRFVCLVVEAADGSGGCVGAWHGTPSLFPMFSSVEGFVFCGCLFFPPSISQSQLLCFPLPSVPQAWWRCPI